MKVFQLSRLSLLASAINGRWTRCRPIDHSKRNQPTAAKQSVRHTIELAIAAPEEAMHGGKSAGTTDQYQNNSNNPNNSAGQSPVSSNSWGFTLTDAAGELVTDNVLTGNAGNDKIEGLRGSDLLIGAKEGILVADLDGDGQIRGGHEMFSDSQVNMEARGLQVLREYDANGDGTITAADFALNHVKVWQDINHDGIAQSHELSTLAQNNITELNYSTGQFTQGGAQRTLALADLSASSAGVVSQQHKYYEIDSKVNRFYAGYLPQMLQKEARNDLHWRSAA